MQGIQARVSVSKEVMKALKEMIDIKEIKVLFIMMRMTMGIKINRMRTLQRAH